MFTTFKVSHCIEEWKDGIEKRFPFVAEIYEKEYMRILSELNEFALNPLTKATMQKLTERLYKNSRVSFNTVSQQKLIKHLCCSARCGVDDDDANNTAQPFISTITNADIENMGWNGLLLEDDGNIDGHS